MPAPRAEVAGELGELALAAREAVVGRLRCRRGRRGDGRRRLAVADADDRRGRRRPGARRGRPALDPLGGYRPRLATPRRLAFGLGELRRQVPDQYRARRHQVVEAVERRVVLVGDHRGADGRRRRGADGRVGRTPGRPRPRPRPRPGEATEGGGLLEGEGAFDHRYSCRASPDCGFDCAIDCVMLDSDALLDVDATDSQDSTEAFRW